MSGPDGSAPLRPRTGPGRLAQGGLVDRSARLSFSFDAKRLSGFAGDTLASALLSANIRVVGRSFKYHRPRGILTAGAAEPNALVELRQGAYREPNTRATVAELFEGLEAHSQNRWPSLGFDLGAINSLLSPLFVAGFYYKTFMWPSALWERLYEPAIRRAAGLGRASVHGDPDRYEKVNAFCDVLVVGAGPGGLAAALTAGRSGARVIVCDEDFLLGGRLNADRREVGGVSGVAWARAVEAELAALPDVRILRRTTVFGAYDGNLSGARTLAAVEKVTDHLATPPGHQPRQRLWRIVARRTIVAAGAIERPLVFGGNDRPGVMLASAIRTYLNRFGVTCGQRVALFTTCDDGWQTAADLSAAGVRVEAIIDPRNAINSRLLAKARSFDAPVLYGAKVIDVRGARGVDRISVRDRAGRIIHLRVDALAMSGGWNPNLALTTHLGGRPRWSETLATFIPEQMPGDMVALGAAAGSFSLDVTLQEGVAAGARAADDTGFRTRATETWRADDEATRVTPLWRVSESTSKAFVDFQHDVTQDDLALAAREGFNSVELLKRYTTLGMATDQGKTSNLNGHGILAELTGRPLADLGTTTYRPPYSPVAVAAFVGPHRGKHYRPTRLTAGHELAREHGASFIETGQWLRAQWFSKPHEKDWLETVTREVRCIRSGVGVCDVSTLGKIDIQGPDAGVFLDRIYTNSFSTLPIGKVRYGLMLREDGLVMDDGTSARLGTEHYVMSTTTANAGKVMQHLDHARQVLWPELDVQLASVTEQWAQYAIAGPDARRLLARLLGAGLDVTNDAFPYLACAQFAWRGAAARLFRISFSGELAYELAVPACLGESTLHAIMTAGAPLDITPYGIEALNVMRIEKGHVAGNELNGTTTADDLGLGRLLSTQKDFIGRVLAARPGLTDPHRAVLVGVKTLDRSTRLHAGAHLLMRGAPATLENDQGHVTSVAFSPMLGQWIGLGLLADGRQRLGERIRVYDALHTTELEAEVVAPVFFDPQGGRLRE